MLLECPQSARADQETQIRPLGTKITVPAIRSSTVPFVCSLKCMHCQCLFVLCDSERVCVCVPLADSVNSSWGSFGRFGELVLDELDFGPFFLVSDKM